MIEIERFIWMFTQDRIRKRLKKACVCCYFKVIRYTFQAAHICHPKLLIHWIIIGDHREQKMAGSSIPHFHNDAGHTIIEVGASEFMCVGANPPFDHPHEFLDMGDEDEIVCPYCSTLFRYNPQLETTCTRPDNCVYAVEAG